MCERTEVDHLHLAGNGKGGDGNARALILTVLEDEVEIVQAKLDRVVDLAEGDLEGGRASEREGG